MNRIACALVLVPIVVLSACGSPDPEDEPAQTVDAALSPTPTVEALEEYSTMDELEQHMPDLDDLEVSELGDHIEVSFTGSEFGDSLEHKATLDIVQAVAKYTGEYEYVMVIGNEPAGTWAYSYDHSTVEEIGAIDDPVVSKIWDVADRSVDPR